jgi:transducin (beta)-like 1
MDTDSPCSGGQDSTVKLFDALSGQTLYTLSGLETGTGSICFSPAAKNLVAGGGWNGKLVIWDIEVSIKRSRQLPSHELTIGQTGKRVKELEIEEDAGKQASREKPMMVSVTESHGASR